MKEKFDDKNQSPAKNHKSNRRRFLTQIAGGASAAFIVAKSGAKLFAAEGSAGNVAGEAKNLASAISLAPDEKRIADLVAQMTLDEKIKMVHGAGNRGQTGYIGLIAANERLKIPPLALVDGPAGIRQGISTAFPAPVTIAASWDESLAEESGAAMGREARAKGQNVLLAPMVNIVRVPEAGRNFETFGEDPFLAARMGVNQIIGIQKQGVIANVKSFAANNQERERQTGSSEVDERTLREIYFPAFEAAVKEAKVWSVMAAYNKINGTPCTEHKWLLTDVLKNEWGFAGFVVSDWNATHSTVGAARAGLDLEMPGETFFGAPLVAAVKKGEVSEAEIDDKVSRVLRGMLACGILDRPFQEEPLDYGAQAAIARRITEAGAVLLKNDGKLLPLKAETLKSIAVIGQTANLTLTGGGGSSLVEPLYAVSPLAAITKRVGAKTIVRYGEAANYSSSTRTESIKLSPPKSETADAKFGGLRGEYFPNANWEGAPKLVRIDRAVNFAWIDGLPAPGFEGNEFSARWTGQLTANETGEYELGLSSNFTGRFFLDGKLTIENLSNRNVAISSVRVNLTAGEPHDIKIECWWRAQSGRPATAQLWALRRDAAKNRAIQDAVKIARQSDVAVVFARDYESEAVDRNTFDLIGLQDLLIREVARANPRTVVVLQTGAAVAVSDWEKQVPSILQAWYAGQETGNAIASLLFGDVNPSGKLPITIARRDEDLATRTKEQYPGVNGKVSYSEGIFVGYRHFDQNKIEPFYAFGHGLSYTDFAYRNMKIKTGDVRRGEKVRVSLSVKNTGSVAGAEIVQLYVSDTASSAARPPKELKGFRKIALKPGEEKEVAFELDDRAFAFWNDKTKAWTIEPGAFKVHLAASSRDVRLTGDVNIGG